MPNGSNSQKHLESGQECISNTCSLLNWCSPKIIYFRLFIKAVFGSWNHMLSGTDPHGSRVVARATPNFRSRSVNFLLTMFFLGSCNTQFYLMNTLSGNFSTHGHKNNFVQHPLKNPGSVPVCYTWNI